MIIFKQVSVKNFLSFGNVPTIVKLNKHKNTLIVGTNGSGKSSIQTDAICFALYGKPYRNINKNQLVNSINQRNLEVEIDFDIGPVQYKVKRGIKPNIFEIYQDGKLVDQEAATKDYQFYLETQILKINYKTFCQVVILGTASFVPFMNLSTAQRRDVIEDVLDIAIFSKMNNILKQRVTETNQELNTIGLKIDSAKKETLSQKKLIQVLEDAKKNRIQEEEENVKLLESEVNDLQSELLALKDKLSRAESEKQEVVDNKLISKLSILIDKLDDELESNTSKCSSIHSLTECPTCLQSVGDNHKHSVSELFVNRNSLIKVDIEQHKINLSELQRKLELYESHETLIKQLNSDISKLHEKIFGKELDVNKKQKLIKNIVSDITDVRKEKDKLKEIADNALLLLNSKSELMDERTIQEISQMLLKDGGIKSAIIKEYVPILNKLINKYLGMFGFHINFVLDENFNETIKSRGRDEFSYSSFSEGEKRKIDTAILFAFRQVAELKNSANCNLLVLDEVGSENFDLNAKECFLEILSSIEGGNNFIISHSAPSHEAYDCVYKVEKRGDFSYMEVMA